MDENISRIAELEKRIRAEKRELESIAEIFESSNEIDAKNKLKYLKAELEYLNSQCQLLSDMVEEKPVKESVQDLSTPKKTITPIATKEKISPAPISKERTSPVAFEKNVSEKPEPIERKAVEKPEALKETGKEKTVGEVEQKEKRFTESSYTENKDNTFTPRTRIWVRDNNPAVEEKPADNVAAKSESSSDKSQKTILDVAKETIQTEDVVSEIKAESTKYEEDKINETAAVSDEKKETESVKEEKEPVDILPEEYEVEQTIEIKKIPESVKTKEEKKKSSIENRIGLWVMPILAATLIFISVILLASALPEVIGNIIKQITMVVAGFSFAGIGVVLKKKKKGGAFGQVLMAIGAGELFVTLVVSRFVFKSINDLWLFILILVWSVAIISLKRFSSVLFQTIGEIGVSIATIFGVCYSVANGHSGLIVVAAFYAISAVVYYLLFKIRGETANKIIFHSFNIVKIAFVAVGAALAINNGFILSGILGYILVVLGLLSAVDAVFTFKSSSMLDCVYGPVSNIFYAAQIYFSAFISTMYLVMKGKGYGIDSVSISNLEDLLSSLSDSRWMMIVAATPLLVILFILLEYVWKELFPKYWGEIMLVLGIMISLMFSHETINYGFIFMIILLTVLGYARKSMVLKVASLSYYILYAFGCDSGILRIIVGLLTAIAVLTLLYTVKEQYSFAIKICVYFALLLYSVTVSNSMTESASLFGLREVIIVSFAATLNLAMMFTGLAKNKEKNYDFAVISELMNIIISPAALIIALVIKMNNGGLEFVALLIGFVLIIVSILRGFLQERILCRVNALLSLFISLVVLAAFDYMAFWFLPTAIILGIVMMYIKKDKYSVWEKLLYYLAALGGTITCTFYFRESLTVSNMFFEEFNVCLIAMTAIALLFKFTGLAKKPGFENRDFDWATYITFAALATFSLGCIGLFKEKQFWIPFILIVFISLIWLINGFIREKHEEKIAVIIFLYFMMIFQSFKTDVAYSIYALVFGALFIAFLYIKKDAYSVWYKIAIYVQLFLNGILIPILFREYFTEYTLMVITSIILVSILCITVIFKFTPLSKDKEGNEDFHFVTLPAFCLIGFYSLVLSPFYHNPDNPLPGIALMVISLIWLINGFLKERLSEKIALIVFAFLMTFFSLAFMPAIYTILMVLLIVGYLFFLYKKTDAYALWQKITIYVLAIFNAIAIPILFRSTLEMLEVFVTLNVVFILLCLVNTLFRFPPLALNPDSDESDMRWFVLINNHILVFFGIIFTFILEAPADILTGLLTLVMVPIATAWIWREDDEDNVTFTIYKYLSVTEYVLVPFVLCYAMSAPAYISSIAGILLAVGCIVLGFVVKMKGIRIYGLVVSMIMVFKLALVDFEKSSLLAYALSFFIAGISCLIISMLYYFVNAAMAERE